MMSGFLTFCVPLVALLTVALAAQPLAAQRGARLVVRAENPLQMARPDETLSLAWGTLRQRLPAVRADRVRVLDATTGAEVVTQVLDADGDGQPDELLVQADFWPGQAREFVVESLAPSAPPTPRVHARHNPPRDDVAWESDRIAFRIYGQGLWQASEYQPLVSSGIDVWLKRVRDPIVERWYEKGHDAYHVDTGEAADFYTVGPTLGAGGSAIWRNGTLYRAQNFKSHRILATGPIRAVFELEYEPWDAGGIQVSEVKRISIDAGQNLFRQEITYRTAGDTELPYVVGTVKRSGLVGSSRRAGPWAWVSTWGPVERKDGGHCELGTAVLMEQARMVETRETDDHYLALATARSGVPTVQYVGAGWTASGDFRTVEDWWRYLDTFGERLTHPIRITLDAGAARDSGR
jgi:pectinesterase